MKKRLTQSEEFEILKLVLDKFLWVGLAIMIIGLWKISNSTLGTGTVFDGVAWIVIGAIILVLLLIIIVKEYEIIR